ncbi:MAG: OmpH family outer membrane protein [Paludibacteraceae bacterium]
MNIKHLFCTIVTIAALGSAIYAQDTLRIGYIDFDQTLAAMEAYNDVQTQLAQLAKNYDDEYARMETEYNNKVKDYIVNGKNLSEPIKLARQAEITEYEERLALYHKRYTDDLAKQRHEREKPVREQLQAAIRQAADALHITLVLDSRTPLYVAAPYIDLTEPVQELLKTPRK